MAPLRYAAKFDPFLSLDCTPTPSTLAQSKERKGSNFAIWQHWPAIRSGAAGPSRRGTSQTSSSWMCRVVQQDGNTYLTAAKHQNKGCFFVHGPHTNTELSFWESQINLNGQLLVIILEDHFMQCEETKPRDIEEKLQVIICCSLAQLKKIHVSSKCRCRSRSQTFKRMGSGGPTWAGDW